MGGSNISRLSTGNASGPESAFRGKGYFGYGNNGPINFAAGGELFAIENNPRDIAWAKRVADGEANVSSGEYVNNAKQVDTAARVYNSASGSRPTAAHAAGMSMFSSDVPAAWGRAIKSGYGNRSVNWLAKNSPDKAIWQTFANTHRGKLHDPSYTLQEIVAAWTNNYGAPWKSLANSLIDFLPHGNGLNIDKLLAGAIPTDFSQIAQQLMSKFNSGGGSDGGGSGGDSTTPTANTAANTAHLNSNTFTYRASDGADATVTIKLMKALYGLDHTDEEWSRDTFTIYTDNQIDSDGNLLPSNLVQSEMVEIDYDEGPVANTGGQ